MMHLSRQSQARGLLIVGLASIHAALFLGVVRDRPHTTDANAPPMFGPVVSEVSREERPRYLTSKEWVRPAPDDSIVPPGSWRFTVIDMWPTDRSRGKLTSFTPVSEAVPGELSADDTVALEKWTKSTNPRSKLRMTGWVRPGYTMQQARKGYEGSVQVSIHVDARGQPIEELLLSSSGYPELDSATLEAARLWRFAPPLSRSEPMSVWAQLELRYHCCEAVQEREPFTTLAH